MSFSGILVGLAVAFVILIIPMVRCLVEADENESQISKGFNTLKYDEVVELGKKSVTPEELEKLNKLREQYLKYE